MRETPLSWPCRLVIATLAAACASQATTPAPRVVAAPPAAPAPREHWPRLEEVKAWPPAAGPFRTQGHLVDAEFAVVRVSPEARDGYLALVTDSSIPDGTVVAAFHQPTGEVAAPGPVYVMVKSAGEWSYLVLDGSGGIVEKNPRGCDGCHAGAVADRLFGPPRPGLRLRP